MSYAEHYTRSTAIRIYALLVALKASYTSSLRPHTLVAEGLIRRYALLVALCSRASSIRAADLLYWLLTCFTVRPVVFYTFNGQFMGFVCAVSLSKEAQGTQLTCFTGRKVQILMQVVRPQVASAWSDAACHTLIVA